LNNVPVRRIEEFRLAEQHEDNPKRGRGAAATGTNRRFLDRKSFSPDEDIETRPSQVGVASSIDELKIEGLTAVIGKLGRKVRRDKDTMLCVFSELVFDRRKPDHSVHCLDLGKQRKPLAIRADLDLRVSVCTNRTPGVTTDEGSFESSSTR
jgi:hypothetical protein